METLANEVWRALAAARKDTRLVALGRSNRHLAWWFPSTVAQLVMQLIRRRVDLVVTGDALTYAVVWPVLKLFAVPSATMIMGLDITHEGRLYRRIVMPVLRRAPRLLAISRATAERAAREGVPCDRISLVRPGVHAPPVTLPDRLDARERLLARFGLDDGAVLLLTLGRLIPRKGARWFIDAIVPNLPASVHYLVAGSGPEAEPIRKLVADRGLGFRVHLLGQVDDEHREELMRGADLFVQPNVAVRGDMEGFGLAVVEVALRGTPVVAADLEGLRDAVIDGETGLLLPTGDAVAWRTTIGRLTADRVALVELGRRFASEATEHFGQAAMSRSLLAALGA